MTGVRLSGRFVEPGGRPHSAGSAAARKGRPGSDRGAVAVEFALILPILVALLLGIMEFGRAYHTQLTLTNAAREGARTMAVLNEAPAALRAVRTAATVVEPDLAGAQIVLSSPVCAPGGTVTVVITHNLASLTGFFGPGWQLTGRAAMRCGG